MQDSMQFPMNNSPGEIDLDKLEVVNKNLTKKEKWIMNFKSLFSARDVTVGKPWQRILELTIPLLIGNIAQQLYNTVDTIVVGKYVGDDALSAVGAAGPVVMMIFILFITISFG